MNEPHYLRGGGPQHGGSRGFLLTLCSNLCMKSSGFEPRKCLIHCTSCLGEFYLVHLVCCSFVNTADTVHPASPPTGWCSYLCKSTGTSTQYQALSFLPALLCSPPCLPLTRDLLKGLILFNITFSTASHLLTWDSEQPSVKTYCLT